MKGMYDATTRLLVGQCYGKRMYTTEREALRVLRRCEEKRPESPLRHYQCKRCRGWHLTKTPHWTPDK